MGVCTATRKPKAASLSIGKLPHLPLVSFLFPMGSFLTSHQDQEASSLTTRKLHHFQLGSCITSHWEAFFIIILLWLFQQHYCYNVIDQSQESQGSYKPARIKEVYSKLHSFQASLCTPTATHLTLFAHTFG